MRRRRGDGHGGVEVMITPMLDMTFQLLFFFIINFNPADQEGLMDMALPSEAVKQADKKENVKPEAAPALGIPPRSAGRSVLMPCPAGRPIRWMSAAHQGRAILGTAPARRSRPQRGSRTVRP